MLERKRLLVVRKVDTLGPLAEIKYKDGYDGCC